MFVLAHRGASAIKPENTLAAFAEALRLNADGIELDVHLTLDGVVVVIHDETTGRTANRDLIVAETTLAELQQLRIDGDLIIPTLQEVLNIMPNGKILNIEIKAFAAIEKTLEIVSDLVYQNIIISSFDFDILVKVREVNKLIPIGVLFEEGFDNAFDFAKIIRAQYLNPSYELLNELNVKCAHLSGLKICCYTVNDILEKERIRNLGVDIIISDIV